MRVRSGRMVGQSFRQHGLARTGRADQDDVVTAGGGDFERAFDVLLSFDIVEVRIVLRMLTEQIFEVHMRARTIVCAPLRNSTTCGKILHAEDFDFAHDGGFRCVVAPAG